MLELKLEQDRLTIEGQLQIRFLDQLKEGLWEAMSVEGRLIMDVSAIEEVDLAGLQLLLAFLRSRQETGETILTGVGAAFAKALNLTGLREHFAKFID